MNEDATAPAEMEPVAEAAVTEAPSDLAPPEPKAEPRSRVDAIRKALEDTGIAEKGQRDSGDTPSPKAEADGEQPRGPDGRFAAKDGVQKLDSATERPQEGEGEQAAKEDAPKADGAPSRFSADAKAEWDKAPASVRGEVSRAIRELETGIQQKDAQLAPLKPYFDMAKQHGVNLADTLGRYVAMETALRQDLRGGLTAIARNYGMTFDEMIAEASGSAAPTGDVASKDREILALRQQVDDLAQQLQGLSTNVHDQRVQTVHAQVEEFARTHPRLEELSGEIVRMIETGYATDLADAYAKAERLNPAPQPMPPGQAAPAQPAAQTRPTRSVTGAPTAGSDPAYRKPSNSRQEAIARAINAVGF